MRVLVLVILFSVNIVRGEGEIQPPAEQPAQNSATAAQNIPFENCTKIFDGINKEKLFYLTLGAVNANRYTVEEIQTYNGYIIFTAARQKYLATISGVDKDNSVIKITPCNNIYYFQPGIVTNIFKFIDINKTKEIK